MKLFYTVTRNTMKEDAGADNLESASARIVEWAEKLKAGKINALFIQFNIEDQKLDIVYFPKL